MDKERLKEYAENYHLLEEYNLLEEYKKWPSRTARIGIILGTGMGYALGIDKFGITPDHISSYALASAAAGALMAGGLGQILDRSQIRFLKAFLVETESQINNLKPTS